MSKAFRHFESFTSFCKHLVIPSVTRNPVKYCGFLFCLISSQRFAVGVDCVLVLANGLCNAVGEVLLACLGHHVGFVFLVADKAKFNEHGRHHRAYENHESRTADARVHLLDFSAIETV